MVETRQGGRCFVTDLTVARLMAPLQFVISLDEASVNSLHEARLIVESGLVRQAATRINEKSLARLEELVAAGFELTNDPLGFRMLDQQFHRLIGELAENPFLAVISQSLYELGMEYRRAATEAPGAIERSAIEHRTVVDALNAGDPEAAAAAMNAHLRTIHETTVIAMQRAEPARPKQPFGR